MEDLRVLVRGLWGFLAFEEVGGDAWLGGWWFYGFDGVGIGF